mmetsp:Transcript_52928/g.121488  ORF Transcript_52928/g.121488 Transcript_52928/m.121488 type:complete len:255 (+) Transcript_52928:521-1285(+)
MATASVRGEPDSGSTGAPVRRVSQPAARCDDRIRAARLAAWAHLLPEAAPGDLDARRDRVRVPLGPAEHERCVQLVAPALAKGRCRISRGLVRGGSEQYARRGKIKIVHEAHMPVRCAGARSLGRQPVLHRHLALPHEALWRRELHVEGLVDGHQPERIVLVHDGRSPAQVLRLAREQQPRVVSREDRALDAVEQLRTARSSTLPVWSSCRTPRDVSACALLRRLAHPEPIEQPQEMRPRRVRKDHSLDPLGGG